MYKENKNNHKDTQLFNMVIIIVVVVVVVVLISYSSKTFMSFTGTFIFKYGENQSADLWLVFVWMVTFQKANSLLGRDQGV